MLVMLVAGMIAGCTGRRFVVGGGKSNGWSQRDDAVEESSEQFVETQPPLVDESETQHVAEIADEPSLPRELPPPVDAVAATAIAASSAGQAVADVATDQPSPTADAAMAPESHQADAESAVVATPTLPGPIRTVSAGPTVEAAPSANAAMAPETAPVRSVSEAELDREFAELRTLRDSLKASFDKSSEVTKSTTQTAMRGTVEEMLEQLASQMTQLSKAPPQSRPAPVQTGAVIPEEQWQALESLPMVEAPNYVVAPPVHQVSHEQPATIPAHDDLLGIGRHLLERGLNHDAEAAFRGAIRLATADEDRALATYLMGVSQIRQKRRGSAEVSFRAVTRMGDAPLAALAQWQLKQMMPRARR